MNIQAEKIELLKMILETDNPNILKSIKNVFIKEANPDFWATLSQDQKDEIMQGIEEIENGETVSYDEFMKKHRK